jgi:hypothetical protein
MYFRLKCFVFSTLFGLVLSNSAFADSLPDTVPAVTAIKEHVSTLHATTKLSEEVIIGSIKLGLASAALASLEIPVAQAVGTGGMWISIRVGVGAVAAGLVGYAFAILWPEEVQADEAGYYLTEKGFQDFLSLPAESMVALASMNPQLDRVTKHLGGELIKLRNAPMPENP